MRTAAVVLALLLLAGRAAAQEAIVLSAGGARGLAHAGVLQELEARGHDPDIVAGTSMGAIIGALYAAGWSADSIADKLEHQDWREAFVPLPVPFGAVAPRHPALRLSASGYLSDLRTNRELVHMLFEPSARARGDFDRLPRRFRAVATDIKSGEAVVLARGDLARAVRASVSQPGFFTSIEWGGRRLVDGAVRDYLPVGVARAAGAKRVIASDTIHPRPGGADSAAFGVAQRSLDWLTVHGAAAQDPPDTWILPAVDPKASPIVYPTDPGPFLRAGREAVGFAAPPPPERPARERVSHALPARLAAARIESHRYAAFLERGFASVTNAAFDAKRVLARVDRAYATGLFDAVWVSVEDTLESPELVVRADPRDVQSILGAVGYDEDRGGRAWLSLERALAARGAPLDVALDGSLDGVTRSAALTLRRPTWSGLTWALGGGVAETEPRGFPDVGRAGGSVGVELRSLAPAAYGAISFRAEHIDDDGGRDGGSYGPELLAGATAPLVQVVGIETRLHATARFGEVDYEAGSAQASWTFGRKRWLLAPLVAVAKVSGDAPLDAWPALGDEHLVPGLRWGDLRGRSLAAAGLDVARVLPKRTTLVLRLRGGSIEERADGAGDEDLGGAALSMLWWLPFGRIELGYEGTTEGDRGAAVRLGASF